MSRFSSQNGVDKMVKGRITLDSTRCNLCKLCVNLCPTKVFKIDKDADRVAIDSDLCVVCYGCIVLCPANAISIEILSYTVIETLKYAE